MAKEPPGKETKVKEQPAHRQEEIIEQEPVPSLWFLLGGLNPDLPPDARQARVKAMQPVIGNRAVQRLITHKQGLTAGNFIQRVEGGKLWVEGPDKPDTRTKEQIEADEAAGAERVKGDIDTFEGHTLTPDPDQAEKVLKSIIAERGFKGAHQFVFEYGLAGRQTAAENRLLRRIDPVLRSKLTELEQRGKDYAEKIFYRRAVEELLRMLADSEKLVRSEARKYGLRFMERGCAPIEEENRLEEMAAAAKVILEKYNQLEEMKKKRKQYEEEFPITESYESGMQLKTRTTGHRTQITDPAAHQKATEEVNAFQKDYFIERQRYEEQFPILASFRPPEGLSKLEDIAGGDVEDRNTAVIEELADKYENIHKIREVANDGEFVYKQEMVVDSTKRVLGVQPGSVEDHGIDAKTEEIEASDVAEQLGLALLSLVGGVILAIPSGGSSLVAAGTTIVGGGMAVAAGGMSIYQGIQEYSTQKAATGTTFDKAQAISQEEPSLFWLAFNIVMAVGDIFAAAVAFSKAARAIRAIEKTADVEAAARQAYRNAGLMNVMPEEEFVQNILLTMKTQPEVVGAATKTRSGLVKSLAEGKHPELTALKAGDERALLDLVKAHGEWKSLIGELENGNETMKTIASKLSDYRQKEVVEKMDELLHAKPMKAGGEELTSDLDFSLASDEMGAGEKLMKAETYMTNKFGKGWEDSLHVHFYTDIESRLRLPEKALENLSEADEALLVLKQHEVSNKLRLARDLHSAGGDRAAIARIERNAKDLGVDIAEVRKLAAAGDEAAKIQRNALLLKIDELEGAYKAAKTAKRTEAAEELAKKIQALQMEANFYTEEAIISPLAAGAKLEGSAAQELQIADSIMEWKTMLQDKVSKYGSVSEAMESYEPWKHMGRQIDEALKKKGLEPALKSRLKLIREKATFTYKERWYPKETRGKFGRTPAKDVEIYNQFIADMTSIAEEIRAEAIRKLGEVAAGAP